MYFICGMIKDYSFQNLILFEVING